MDLGNLDDLRKEFEQMAGTCTLNPEGGAHNEHEDSENEDIPHYVEELLKKLLAPSIAGVYLTRIDLKRIADDLDASLPIKERKKMLRALMRHITTKASLREIFEVMNRYIDGRILIYQELAEDFPASKVIFEGFIQKATKTKNMFDRIVDDFEEFEVTDEPLMI